MTTINDIQVVIDSPQEIPNTNKSTSKMVNNIESDEIPICRICLEPRSEALDPILPLGCGCRHGLATAHKKCLIKWFSQRRFLSLTTFDGLPNSKKCEICKKKLSPSIRRLLNDHWVRFFEQEMINFSMSQQGIQLRAAERTTHGATHEHGITCLDAGYFISFAIIVFAIVSFICFELSLN